MTDQEAPMEFVYRCVNTLGRIALALLGIRVRVRGIEHLPRTGPVIIAATHASYLDFVVVEKVAAGRGRYVRFLARHDVWHSRVVAWFMDRMRHVPVDRSVPVAAYLQARRELADGQALGIFPEAGISYSFTVRALMPGAVALARESGAPIVPMAMWGAQRIHTVGIPEPRPDLTRGRRVDALLGEPIRIAPGADLVAETTRLGHRLTELLEDLQKLSHHRPMSGDHAPWYPAHLGGHAPTRAQAREKDVVPATAVAPSWGPCDPEHSRRPGLGA